MSAPSVTLPTVPQEIFASQLLAPYAHRVTVAFTGKPHPVGSANVHDAQAPQTRAAWCEALGFAHADLLFLEQVHGDRRVILSQHTQPGTFHGKLQADAIVVDVSQRPALIRIADCVPVALYDPVQHVGAVIHAGWRSTRLRISAKTAQDLMQSYGCQPQNMLAVIGPAISLPAYEVGKDVYDALASDACPDGVAPAVWSTPGKDAQHSHVDTQMLNRLQLEAVGITQIEVMSHCTYQETDRLWSHRRGDAERQGLFMMLQP